MKRSSIIVLLVLLFIAIFSGYYILFRSASKAQNKSNAIEMTTEKSRYYTGEPIRMTVRMTNYSKTAIGSYYRSSQKYDFIVKDKNGKIIWQWSYGKMFLMALSQFMLKPGENISYSFMWDQKDNSKKAVPAGAYTIIGEIKIFPFIRASKKIIIISK
jgi:hypothetical protein